jgi:N-acetylmuramoyl-L-alanine amidase.
LSDVQILVNELRARGVVVHEWDGWYGRGNEDTPQIDIRGAIIHHTGSNYGSAYEGLVYSKQDWAYGNALCNFSGNADGSVTVIASGLTWHAGGGYGPSQGPLSPYAGNRNYYTVGLEIVYPGNKPMTDAQYATSKKFGRTVADLFADGNLEYVRGHGEVNGRGYDGKWDPGWAPGQMIDMNVFRAQAAAIPDVEPPLPEPPVEEEKESMFQSVFVPATLPDVLNESITTLPWQGGNGGVTEVYVNLTAGSGGAKLGVAQWLVAELENGVWKRKPVDIVPKGTVITGFADMGGHQAPAGTYAVFLQYTATAGASLLIEAV